MAADLLRDLLHGKAEVFIAALGGEADGALVLGDQIAAPAVVDHQPDDVPIGNGGLVEVLVHVGELGVAGPAVGQELHDLLRLGHIPEAHGHPLHALGGFGLEGAEVDVEAEVLGAGAVDELQILVADVGRVQGGGSVDLILHAHIVLLGVGQCLLNVGLPARLRIAEVVDAGDLCAQGLEAQQVGQLEVPLQQGHHLLVGGSGTAVQMVLRPVAQLRGLELVLFAQTPVLVHPGGGRVGIVVDIAGQEFEAGCAGIIHLQEHVLQGHGLAQEHLIAVDADASLRMAFFHIGSLLVCNL